jgi:hypothetical protein
MCGSSALQVLVEENLEFETESPNGRAGAAASKGPIQVSPRREAPASPSHLTGGDHSSGGQSPLLRAERLRRDQLVLDMSHKFFLHLLVTLSNFSLSRMLPLFTYGGCVQIDSCALVGTVVLLSWLRFRPGASDLVPVSRVLLSDSAWLTFSQHCAIAVGLEVLVYVGAVFSARWFGVGKSLPDRTTPFIA